jgi:hypothetical protein
MDITGILYRYPIYTWLPLKVHNIALAIINYLQYSFYAAWPLEHPPACSISDLGGSRSCRSGFLRKAFCQPMHIFSLYKRAGLSAVAEPDAHAQVRSWDTSPS